MSCKATINSLPHPALAISGDAPDPNVFGLIGQLSYDLMVPWGKQADDDCDGALMSQKRVDADSVVWLQVLSTHTDLHHNSRSNNEVNETCPSTPPTPFLCLSFTYSFPFCYFHSIYVIRGLWICTTLVKILSNLTWIRTVTVKINVPLLYLHILAREQQFIRSDPTFQGWCVLMVKNNPESTVAAQQKLYHSVRMPKFQLMQIPS